MDNKCITCGKRVTGPTAEKAVMRNGRTYLVCCPLCECEFDHKREHYLTVAESISPEAGASRLSPSRDNAGYAEYEEADVAVVDASRKLVQLLRSLHNGFDDIQSKYRELYRHFDQIYDAGGFDGLRRSLAMHQNMMDKLRRNISIHASVCRFVMAVAESSVNGRGWAESPDVSIGNKGTLL